MPHQDLLDLIPGRMRPGKGNDDVCDCPFPDVREEKNPYLGKTLRYRWCCLLESLEKLFPEHFEHLDAFFDDGTHETAYTPREWPADMGDEPTFIKRHKVA